MTGFRRPGTFGNHVRDGKPGRTSETPKSSAAKSIGSLGIVFGDIGTSPIYTSRECLGAAGKGPDPATVTELLSLIPWTLVVVTTLRYVVFVMRADNDGEGLITPAISVLSAVEGLDTATPTFHPYIVPITVAVLVALPGRSVEIGMRIDL